MPLAPLRRVPDAVEMLDRPASFTDLSDCLDAIARLNAWFGGRFLTLRHVQRLLARLPVGRPATVLDVGTGSADIPRALVQWARRAGRSLRVIALDRDPAMLQVARRSLADCPEIVLLQGDALCLPVRPESVDVVMSTLTLHHLEPEPAVRYLSELDAAARTGWVVNDLLRSRLAYAMVWLATRALTRNRMARHDGPLSVRRAYTPAEAVLLCEKAGLFTVRVVSYGALLRQCAIRVKS
ncbi:MAG TPA: methyltransferase domain-containing protein [Methylomirabilota bacterium]|nr:methyltransferase domain-containing protein [Methylomirabilota bacterium]